MMDGIDLDVSQARALNPGPLSDHKTVEEVLEIVDDTVFGVDDWNIVVIECKSLAAKWEQLSIYLGLSFEVTDNIKGSGDNHHCWSEALKHWIKQNFNTKKFGAPSWKSLLAAVAKVDKLRFKDLASGHLIQESSEEYHQHPEQMRISAAPVRSTESRCAELKGGTPEVGRAPSSPVSPSVNLSPEEKQRHYERVSSKSHVMMYKFQKFFTSTKKSLREEKVSASELVGHLACLGFVKPTFKDTGKLPLRHQLPKLETSETVDDVMFVVKDYCSFFNYQMLEHITEEFGTPKDKGNLAAYKKDFEEYAQCCVVEGSMEVGKMSKEGFSNMLVTLDDSFDNCTLSHLNIFIADVRKVLNISSDIDLRLCYISRGSIKLTFQFPLSLRQGLFPLSPEQEASLAALGVVKLLSEDYQFTRQQKKLSGQQEVEDPCAFDDEGFAGYNDDDQSYHDPITGDNDSDDEDHGEPYYIIIPKGDELMPKECIFDRIERAEANKLLRLKNRDGTYLIRDGSHTGADKVLSVWHIDRCHHYKLFKGSSGMFSLTQGEAFRTIPELLLYYSLQSHLPRSDFYLGDPYYPNDYNDDEDDGDPLDIMIPKVDELMPKECIFDRLERAEANKLLQSKNCDGTYLIRDGSHTGADKVLSVWYIDRGCHYKVFKSPSGIFSLTRGQSFRTIPELLQYYSLHSRLPRSEIYLGDPYKPSDSD